MKKAGVCVLACMLLGLSSLPFAASSHAQPVDVSWLPFGHAGTPNGWYGERGVADPRNAPGPREGAVTWRGVDGRIWMFGGIGMGERGDAGFLDDLWSYDVAFNTWTWVTGTRNARAAMIDATAGSQSDVQSERHAPGPRFGATGWTGTNGDLFLAGGVEWPSSNQAGPPAVWRFDPIMEVWARASPYDILDDVENRLLSIQGMMTQEALESLRGHLRIARSGLERNDVLGVLGGIVLLRTELPGDPHSFLERFMAPARLATDMALEGVTFQMAPDHAPQVDAMMAMLAAVDESDSPVLESNFPNPFSSSTTVRVRLREAGHMSLTVYDVLGREVMRLSDGSAAEGRHEFQWDGRDAAGRQVPSGVYLYRLRTETLDQSRLMTLVR